MKFGKKENLLGLGKMPLRVAIGAESTTIDNFRCSDSMSNNRNTYARAPVLII